MTKTGRPTKYTLDYVRAEAQAFLAFVKKKSSVLFLEEFIEKRDYGPQRWSEWKRDFGNDEEFSEAIKKGESILELRLVKAGLTGKHNATMSIFVLANKHGYTRQDRERPDEGKPKRTIPNRHYHGKDMSYRNDP